MRKWTGTGINRRLVAYGDSDDEESIAPSVSSRRTLSSLRPQKGVQPWDDVPIRAYEAKERDGGYSASTSSWRARSKDSRRLEERLDFSSRPPASPPARSNLTSRESRNGKGGRVSASPGPAAKPKKGASSGWQVRKTSPPRDIHDLRQSADSWDAQSRASTARTSARASDAPSKLAPWRNTSALRSKSVPAPQPVPRDPAKLYKRPSSGLNRSASATPSVASSRRTGGYQSRPYQVRSPVDAQKSRPRMGYGQDRDFEDDVSEAPASRMGSTRGHGARPRAEQSGGLRL